MAKYPHFRLQYTATPGQYTYPKNLRIKFRTPQRDQPKDHGNLLLTQIQKAKELADSELPKEPATDGLHFIPISFRGDLQSPEGNRFDGLKLDSLETKDGQIRVINVRVDQDVQIATVAVPKEKIEYFVKRFKEYSEKERKNNNPYHKDLVESISEIRLAALKDYYTDSDNNLPQISETIWWEVWLEGHNDDDGESFFREKAQQLGIKLSKQTVRFPEVIVILAHTSFGDWSNFPGLLNHLAELRRAKVVPTEFIDLEPVDQAGLINDMLTRIQFPNGNAPAVCILDRGVNRGHPLIQGSLLEEDTQSWNPEWTPADKYGHGTEMAGIALFGTRLRDWLLNKEKILLDHCLESVKIMPDRGENEPPDYGPITVGSMALAETQAPYRNRVFCLAVTADDRDEWLPTLWSASLDQACSGAIDEFRRLLFVSAGNLNLKAIPNYPDDNQRASIQDPSQSWNVLTVGAHTEIVWIQHGDLKGWSPLAPKGQLSPRSTTSISWDEQDWPLKPEIVLEGGNYAKDESGFASCVDDLSLLTTRLEDTGALLGTTCDTSPATAQAARMAAIIQSEYPDYWPETIRGLLVHTANWTKEMKKQFPRKKNNKKSGKVPGARLRCYGWGVPNLERALGCTRNIATIIIEDSLIPFKKTEKGKIETNQINVHALPMPKEILNDLGDEEVRMRVTLSYFVEPSPGRKGWKKKHRYASHGLRFNVKRPTESLDEFRQHLSREFWPKSDEDPNKKEPPDKRDNESRDWVIGEYGQNKGSIHSDWWQGTASQLAESEYIGIYPVTGWWRERPNQHCYDKIARYSLIVSIQTRKEEIELYNAVEQEINIPVEIKTEV